MQTATPGLGGCVCPQTYGSLKNGPQVLNTQHHPRTYTQYTSYTHTHPPYTQYLTHTIHTHTHHTYTQPVLVRSLVSRLSCSQTPRKSSHGNTNLNRSQNVAGFLSIAKVNSFGLQVGVGLEKNVSFLATGAAVLKHRTSTLEPEAMNANSARPGEGGTECLSPTQEGALLRSFAAVLLPETTAVCS